MARVLGPILPRGLRGRAPSGCRAAEPAHQKHVLARSGMRFIVTQAVGEYVVVTEGWFFSVTVVMGGHRVLSERVNFSVFVALGGTAATPIV